MYCTLHNLCFSSPLVERKRYKERIFRIIILVEILFHRESLRVGKTSKITVYRSMVQFFPLLTSKAPPESLMKRSWLLWIHGIIEDGKDLQDHQVQTLTKHHCAHKAHCEVGF